MSKYSKIIKFLGKNRALDSATAERLLVMNAEQKDGGAGSGNWGHAGRPNKVGGSAPSGSGGKAAGNAGRAKNGTVYSGKDFTLKARGLRTLKRKTGKDGRTQWVGTGRTWEAKGKKSKILPNGSGTTRILEQDVVTGLHTINKYLTPDGKLTPERAALHEKIIQGLFKGKKPKGPGEQKTLYFLGGGSASGKGSFTSPGTADKYGMPDKNAVTVVDADELKKALPEYDPNSDTGTTDRRKAANFAHEESSALAKRAMEAAYANGYDVTLDGTGDSGAKKVIKKIEEARRNGYRVEGRYCSADIEEALRRNEERAIKEGRLVDKDSVIGIHKDVSSIFQEIAPHFDHIELWDHDGPEPRLVATCEKGQTVKVKEGSEALWKKFLDKAKYGES